MPLVVVEPELATPNSTTMNVPIPSTTQMISRISTCGFARRNSADLSHSVHAATNRLAVGHAKMLG